MTETNTQPKVEDLYEKLLRLVIEEKFQQALELLNTVESTTARLDLLKRVTRALDLDSVLARARDYAFVLIRALAFPIAFAHELDRDLAFARDLDSALVLARDRDLEELIRSINQAQHINRFILAALESEDYVVENSTVILIGHAPLTTLVLVRDVVPYLDALIELQQIIAEMRDETFVEPIILELSHHSPVSINFTGTLTEAVATFGDIVIPWRRKRKKELADLELNEKSVDVAKAEAEIQEIKARTGQIEGDPELATIARERARAEVERMHLENERLRLELDKDKIALGVSIIDQFAPGLSEQERLMYILKLVKPLNVLGDSHLEIDVSE